MLRRHLALAFGQLRALDRIAVRRPRLAHVADHQAAGCFELDVGHVLQTVRDTVTLFHGFRVVGVVAQNQFALFQRLVVFSGGVELARAAQVATRLIALCFVIFFVDAMRDTGGVGDRLGGLVIAFFHCQLGVAIEGFGDSGLRFLAGGYGRRAVADKIEGLLVLITGQGVIAVMQRLACGRERGITMIIQ